MNIQIQNKIIYFSDDEIDTFKKFGLEIDTEFLELLLYWDNETDISLLNDNDAHKACIHAICEYSEIIKQTLNNIGPKDFDHD